MKYFEKVRGSRGRRRRRLGAKPKRDYTQTVLAAFGSRASAPGKAADGRGSAGSKTSLKMPPSVLTALQSKGIASTVTSQKNSVQLDGLQPDARYVVQVRARTVAGYGQYSRPAEFETTSERGITPLPLRADPRPQLTSFSSLHSLPTLDLQAQVPSSFRSSFPLLWAPRSPGSSSWWLSWSSPSSASGTVLAGPGRPTD